MHGENSTAHHVGHAHGEGSLLRLSDYHDKAGWSENQQVIPATKRQMSFPRLEFTRSNLWVKFPAFPSLAKKSQRVDAIP